MTSSSATAPCLWTSWSQLCQNTWMRKRQVKFPAQRMRSMPDIPDTHCGPQLPSQRLAAAQAVWLRGVRARLLRLAGITRRETIVDVGAGWGMVADEIAQRTGRVVVAIDADRRPLAAAAANYPRTLLPVQALAERLPLAAQSCDLVFTQFACVWFAAVARVIDEVHRVLCRGGVLVAIEPDYGGMMEYPLQFSLAEIWLAAVQRAGGDPLIGRKLPSLCRQVGLDTQVLFCDRLEPFSQLCFDHLRELPLADEEERQVGEIQARLATQPTEFVSHLPCWLIVAEKT